MKKLIIGITAPPSVDLLQGQLNYLKKKGYDVYLLAPDADRVRVFCEQEGIPLLKIKIQRNISPFKDLMTLILLIRLFLRESPDIINMGTPKISLLGMIAGYLTRVPVRIYTCRGFRFEHEKRRTKSLLKIFEKVTSLCSHKVFCISKSLRDLGVKEHIFKEGKTILIEQGSSNGVDLNLFKAKNLDSDILDKLKEDYQLNGYFTFGFVGRLVDRKGIREMYLAFDKLYQKKPFIRLLVVGRPFWDQIKDPCLIEKMNKHQGIIMAGFQKIDLVPYFLSIMDCFLMPAWWEGFGNVFIQAAAMGIPIIGTNATGAKDAVKDGYNGVLVPPKDVELLVSKMEEMINNEDKRTDFGKNGILWSKNFLPEKIWEGYYKMYKSFE